MRKFLFSFLLSTAVATVFGQKPVIISARGGISHTSSSAKGNSYLGNGYNAGADVFFSLYCKDWDATVKGGGLTLGIIISGNYNTLKNLSPDNAAVANQYQVFGGNTIVASQPNAKTSGSFSGMAGLQGIFSFGKFDIAPSLNAGYLQLKQKGYVQNGSAEINGQAYKAALVKSEAQSTSGFVFMPQVKIGYNITPGLAFFVSPSVLMGPEVKHVTQHLVPQGGFNERNTYEIKQLAGGTWKNSNTTTSKYNLTRINFGVSFSLGRRSKSTIPSRLSMTPTTTRQTQGNNFGEKVASGMQSGRIAKPGGAVSSSYAAGRVAGSPIGGIVVKGGKNPGGNLMTVVTNEKGEVELNGLEKGMYKFSLTMPDEPQDKSINEKGVKRQAAQDFNTTRSNRDNRFATSPDADGTQSSNLQKAEARDFNTTRSNRDNRLSTNPGTGDTQSGDPQRAEVQDFNSSRSNKDRRQLAARPGSPIGGIVVKGGKNPGGNMTNLNVGNDGTIEFEVLEAGDYKFIIQVPENTNNNMSEEKKDKLKEPAKSGLKDTLKTNV